MISQMTKYSFILLAEGQEKFLKDLQELGVVDISRSTKPVDDRSSALLAEAGEFRGALTKLTKADWSKDTAYAGIVKRAEGFSFSDADAKDIVRISARAFSELDELSSQLLSARKEMKLRMPWGEFDINAIDTLKGLGYDFHFYALPVKSFEAIETGGQAVQVISNDGQKVYFVVVSPSDE